MGEKIGRIPCFANPSLHHSITPKLHYHTGMASNKMLLKIP
jgi:hypothetical protein